jgi:glycosyltransferase involved in cell wall biosynthesis
MCDLSVVVPVYGCCGCLRALHQRLSATLAPLGVSYELVFIDDASTDGAWEVLVELAGEDRAVRAFALSRNFGQDAAITAGLAKSRGHWTVVMDCDLQEQPESIPALYAAREGVDIVRTSREGARRHSRSRRVASRLYRRLLLESGKEIEYSTMSLLSRPVVEAFLGLRDHDREYASVLDWLGFRQAVVPIEYVDRHDGSSSYSLRRLWRVALSGAFFRTTILLRVVVLLGFLVVAVGVMLAAYNIIYYFAGRQPAGYTSLAVLILLTTGFIIVSLGVVGLYVGRIFEQVKERPLFIISRMAEGADQTVEAPDAAQSHEAPGGSRPAEAPRVGLGR